MKKFILSMAAAVAFFVPAAAAVSAEAEMDGGMWLPMLISQRIDDMHAHGFRLTADDIYNVNQASLKDAVVLFGRGCTGELISDQGLLITNHHCGYSWIQKHSAVGHDYLTDGYWARSREEEIPDPGLTVSFLERMEDVTARVLSGVTPDMSEQDREALVYAAEKDIVREAVAGGKGLRASVEALYYGNQYFLFVYREYSDVRFVGAPPSSIGKFGGDTDNWMWPRHTGDFSMFRIYADKDNNPAQYSEDNVPYKPKKSFRISAAGVKEGDFTMVYGFPGSTREYIHSDEVKYIQNVSDPEKIALRTLRLQIQKKYMNADRAVRIQYASKNATVANAWKKWQGEVKGLLKNDIVAQKQAYERGFENWAKGTEYEGITSKLAAIYAEREPIMFAYEYWMESIYSCELLSAAYRSAGYSAEVRKAYLEGFYKDYYLPIDKECFAALLEQYEKNVPDQMKPEWYKAESVKYASKQAWADEMFSKSAFADKQTALAEDLDIKSDPAYVMAAAFMDWYRKDIKEQLSDINMRLALANRTYMRGQMAYEPDKAFFPDANLTLRVAYGNVAGYAPADGVWYKPQSTLKGIIEKDNPEIYDYNIPQALRDIYAAGGCEAVPVCFIATNHTTGGNSGSPVLNADGDLIGINFDRVWEGTMSDIAFDPDICRNIALDMRYVLFILDKLAGAQNILNELTVVGKQAAAGN